MYAVILDTDRSLNVRQIEKPKEHPGEIVLQVVSCGICRSDQRAIQRGVKTPIILGHEIVAQDPSGFLVVDPLIPCRCCRSCLHGKFNVCEKPSIVGITRSGGYAQYVSVPHEQIYPIPSKLSKEEASLIQPLSCVMHGYERLGQKVGNKVLIAGAGPIGLLWLLMLKKYRNVSVVQVDEVESRVQLARNLGANLAIHTKMCHLHKKLSQETFDVIVEATGDVKVVASVLPFLARGGSLLCFGVYRPQDLLDLHIAKFMSMEQTLITSRMHVGEFQKAISLLQDKIVPRNILAATVVSLHQVPEVLRTLDKLRHTSIKILVDPWM